ncbi:immune inhibitor A [Streptomyces sp. NA04227]|uniref:immune inhibitor A domain-containing protein n=1 Tax=Streptomyces sp. NA04227 TaxID=2742136 RepID=UPI00158FE212|nr:immune inhibitor A domain-containing protein [Streptomyces sp. NA04227]QKW06766.1 immune inhibitor A [Streptomyces sp. NA04227]
MTSRKRTFRATAVAVALAAATAGLAVANSAQAGETEDRPQSVERHDPAPGAELDKHGHEVPEHNLAGPFTKKADAQRKAALEQVLSGEAKVEKRGASNVVKLDNKKYVELGREKTDKIFTILVEFGDKVDKESTFDPDGDGPKPPVTKYGGDPGPARNQIAEPDRKDDNSTAWKKDFNREHFQDLYFGEGKDSDGKKKESLKTYYERTSSGRYSVEGEVSDWVKVPWNEGRYGSNYCGDHNCPNVWDTVKDGVTAWVADQKEQGKTDAEIKQTLAKYDAWDRYDFDSDGNFNESDGYIDHFQIVHAGEDESAGGGAQGEHALWAHRWYAYGDEAGHTGPANNKAGGTQIGDTGIWVGDYTMQPENGGLGVFAHEYGHDLGLPDHYDTTGGGDNSVGFWSLMSAGSWLGTGKESIGDLPGDMTSWDKLQLGWLKYTKGKAATKSTHKLGVSEYNTKNPQALLVELPKKKVTTTVVKPTEGSKQWWSNQGDNLKNTLSRSVDLTGKQKAELTLNGWWDIEKGYDYLYTEVSTDGGKQFTPLNGTADGKEITKDGADRPALTDVSKTYKKLVFPLDEYAGKKIDLRFRYNTDGGAGGKGFAADEIVVNADGKALFSDNAEGDDNGWTVNGFSRIGESFTKDYEQYYIAENRQYVSYDKTLKVGPYNFGWRESRPNWVEHYPYQNGLLVWLWDSSQKDNNTSVHPGTGLILPVDAHPKALKWKDGKVMVNKIQTFDSTFTTARTDAFTLHSKDVAVKLPALKGNSVFNDRTGTYWFKDNPTGSVKVPDTNTQIKIAGWGKDGSTVTVKVAPAK